MYQMRKLVIANNGAGGHGKTASIKYVYKLLLEKGAQNEKTICDDNDICVVLTLDGVMVGIESCGDCRPYFRMQETLPILRNSGCDIIVCACRTYGDTLYEVERFLPDYDIVFASNPQTVLEPLMDYLNKEYAKNVVRMIEDRIHGKW